MRTFLKFSLFFVIFTICTAAIFAQTTFTGSVFDADHQPVIGANIVVKGTTTGVNTDINGNFTIKLPSPESTLVISFIGYITKEVKVAGQMFSAELALCEERV